MQALLVNVTLHEREPALAVLREQVVPRASRMPGFVAGYWMVSMTTAERTCWCSNPRRRRRRWRG